MRVILAAYLAFKIAFSTKLIPFSFTDKTLKLFWGMSSMFRSDKILRKLEALLIVADAKNTLMITGQGDVIEPENNTLIAIGSGGSYAQAAAKALIENTDLDAKQIVKKSLEITSDICIYTNSSITIKTLNNEVK